MVRKKILNSKLAGIIRHYSRILKQSGIGFEEIILFGSQAKGTARKWSDIDLAIVSTDFGKDSHAELVK
ncbi:MAG: Nucleotidyltransferase [Candidatus Nomurabacteria bacterium GW2011_GWB1_37_5]|uniref:Nucleotidyltransferase n=1 Tax=Candidatus Nomurabacteria bacterium GW2011_GWB1_37_5 TaxID=1618742 RepID=A0A0G0GT79_9BACT|nr:MAG: Nucleotidyltransferase [Candidatus Nomurabacteria bacterium GW2011_GWB1_37_5]